MFGSAGMNQHPQPSSDQEVEPKVHGNLLDYSSALLNALHSKYTAEKN